MSIGLVTDSSADLPAAVAAAHEIEVIPLEVRLGAETFRDGLDLSTEEFFRRVSTDSLAPKTSQPPVGVFVQTYRNLLARHESIISIHLAGDLSGTYAAAEVARQSLPGADITIVDSCSVSLGLGLLVVRAARALRDGMSKEKILQLLGDAKERVEVLVALNTLEFLERGGRLGKVAAFLGSLLNLKPLIKVAGGQVLPLVKARSRGQCVDQLLLHLAPLAQRGKLLLGVMHTVAAGEAEELRRRLQDLYGKVEMVVQAGPVLGAHAGPGALAVAVVPA
ncbi:MAG: DegV family protein [Bacteroidota bacterium]